MNLQSRDSTIASKAWKLNCISKDSLTTLSESKMRNFLLRIANSLILSTSSKIICLARLKSLI
jgi:hypothetical protein